MSQIEIKVPDIGDFKEVEVIELLVKVGDVVKPEQSLITVESDKASMEIPSSHAGIVKELKVKLGDKVCTNASSRNTCCSHSCKSSACRCFSSCSCNTNARRDCSSCRGGSRWTASTCFTLSA